MPIPKIVVIEEEEDVVCPICKTLIIDAEEGLAEQPSCPHIRFVYANGEAFEYDPEGLEQRLNSAQEKADEAGDSFDEWNWLLAQCDQRDVILEHNSEEMACGAISFTTWIGIRREHRDSRSSRSPVVAVSDAEYTCGDHRIFFQPTAKFIRWMTAQFKGKLIYDLGSGMGHVAKALATAGLHVIALDLEPRIGSQFAVVKADSTTFPFERGAVVMFCRPSHSGFVEKTLTKAIQRDVSHILYVGLTKNLQNDLGSIHDRFTKRRVGAVGNSDERVWELNVGRLRAEAFLRRSIPRLSPYVLQ